MTTKLPKIDVKYICKVLRFIENGPKLRFDMGTYYDRMDPKENTKAELRSNRYPACGTKGCFAGWGVLLQKKKSEWGDVNYGQVRSEAAKLFGFTDDECEVVFNGEGTNYLTFGKQLRGLKRSLNRVFKERGMKERV